MQTAATAPTTTTTERPVNINKLIDTPKVRIFLQRKAKKSYATAEGLYNGGMTALYKFVQTQYPKYTIETIIKPLKSGKIDIYRFLDDFVHQLPNTGQTPINYLSVVKKYLSYYEVYVHPEIFKNRVIVPQPRVEEMAPLEIADVRKILLAINSQRLKAFCLEKASMGYRAVEGLAIQCENIDLSTYPIGLYMKAAFSKNKLPRNVWIGDEAWEEWKKWIKYKYGTSDVEKALKEHPKDYLFSSAKGSTPQGMYDGFSAKFRTVLKSIDMASLRDNAGGRHEITLHSLRAFVETTVEDNTSSNFAHYVLGHKKSTYYRHKDPERRQIYLEKCLPHLTFLDYNKMEAKIVEKDRQLAEHGALKGKEMFNLMRRFKENNDEMADMRARLKAAGL